MAILRHLSFCLALLTAGTSLAGEMSQADLRELEELLARLGFPPGEVDGVLDEETRRAIGQYQVFAALPGEPEPSAALLSELRGVAQQVRALRETREAEPDIGNFGQAETERPSVADHGMTDASEPAVPEPETAEPAVAEPKAADPEPRATVADSEEPPEAPEDAALASPVNEAASEVPTVEPAETPIEPMQTSADKAAAETQTMAAPAEPEPEASAETITEGTQQPPAEAALPTQAAPATTDGSPSAVPEQEARLTDQPDPAALERVRIKKALAPYREALSSGELSYADLARTFNEMGRQRLRTAQLELAVEHFSTAIYLQPNLAAAYHNRGTAYQALGDAERAQQDFDQAFALGFKRLLQSQ